MKDQITKDIIKALEVLTKEASFSWKTNQVLVEEPKSAVFGEYTSNIALVLAKDAKKNPFELAESLAKLLTNDNYVVNVVAPGYLNFAVSSQVLRETVATILEKGSEYGSKKQEHEEKINNEFISANPTGPLHVGNGRGGILWR